MTHNILLSSKMLLRVLLATHSPETCRYLVYAGVRVLQRVINNGDDVASPYSLKLKTQYYSDINLDT